MSNWPPEQNCLHSIKARERRIILHGTTFRCPVCLGSGHVPAGFYNVAGALTWTSSTTTPETCRTCEGAGIVWR